MKVACLMGTYGRRSFACDALACFLQQTALQHATLLIYNQHPTPMSFDHPQVRVVNEAIPNLTFRRIRARMVELADSDADFIHWWDDDDLILPWHLESSLSHVGDRMAWKPHRSWAWRGPGQFELMHSYFEGTVTMRARFVRDAPMNTHPDYLDHPANMQLFDQNLIATTEMGDMSSYVYRWGTHAAHLSQRAGARQDEHVDALDAHRAGLTDAGDGGPLVPSDLWPLWEKFLDGIAPLVQPGNLAEIRMRLAVAEALGGAGGAP